MNIDELIGLTEEAARARVREAGMRFRITRIDGKGQIVTADLRADRVNVHLCNGRVTEVGIG